MAHQRGRYQPVGRDGYWPAKGSAMHESYLNPHLQGQQYGRSSRSGRPDTKYGRARSPSSKNDSDERGSTRNAVPGMGAFLLEWWQELAAILLSAAFLIAALLVLFKIHDTPLEAWTAPWSVQPATLIATLIAFCKLFLLVAVAEAISQLKWVHFESKTHHLDDLEHFDSASRGVFGAICFVFLVRWRAVLACVGALLVVLAIGMEPFAQQTLSFYNKAVIADGSVASVPRATSYDLDTLPEYSPYVGTLNSQSQNSFHRSVSDG